MSTYTGDHHKRITINGQVIDKRKVILAYVKFINGGIKKFSAKRAIGKIPGIQFNCLDENNVKNGTVTVTVDGKLSATISTLAILLEKQLLFINNKIEEVCNFINTDIVDIETLIVDEYIVKDGTYKTPNEIKNISSIQKPGTSFYMKPPGDEFAPFVLKGDLLDLTLV